MFFIRHLYITLSNPIYSNYINNQTTTVLLVKNKFFVIYRRINTRYILLNIYRKYRKPLRETQHPFSAYDLPIILISHF